MKLPIQYGAVKVIAVWLLLAATGLYYDSCRHPKQLVAPTSEEDRVKADAILATANQLMGTSYAEAGTTPRGFDCSGFTSYVFAQNGITIPHSSKEQIKLGIEVPQCSAAKGDLIVFTGTNAMVREAGHVGIVVENNNCVITFIHASSSKKDSGVKLNTTQEGYYEQRFLQVRRILK